ncbi:hypothetical protein SDC9_155591 [bioreactor metagenome]|uniref:Uncharacterized protein n=1 Tax=bioreactor metagenome TaxID=1076179 RepID=A0A645F4F2_9ZZZZ
MQQLVLGLLAFADVEHEADQGFHFSVAAYYMDNVAYPHIPAVPAQGAIVCFMITTGLGLGDTESDDAVPVIRVHAVRPVLDADPAVRCPAEEGFDLRTDVCEAHRLPVDAPGNGPGGLE